MRFKLTIPEPQELDIHQAVASALDVLLMPPAMWRSIGDGHLRLSPAETARLFRIGVKPGWPDILILHRGLLLGLELKRKGGRLSKTRIGRTRRGSPKIYEGQEDVFPKLRAAGMPIEVVHSVDEALLMIRSWGIPLRATAAITGEDYERTQAQT